MVGWVGCWMVGWFGGWVGACVAGFYKHITNSAQTEVGAGAELGKINDYLQKPQ